MIYDEVTTSYHRNRVVHSVILNGKLHNWTSEKAYYKEAKWYKSKCFVQSMGRGAARMIDDLIIEASAG